MASTAYQQNIHFAGAIQRCRGLNSICEVTIRTTALEISNAAEHETHMVAWHLRNVVVTRAADMSRNRLPAIEQKACSRDR